MPTLTLSFEEEVLSSHDWTAKLSKPTVVEVAQDDYDDGIQDIYVTFSDGTRIHEIREWNGEDHDAWMQMIEAGCEPVENYEFILQNSELRKEEELQRHDRQGSVAQPPSVLSTEEINTLSMELFGSVGSMLSSKFNDLAHLFKARTQRNQIRDNFNIEEYDFYKFCKAIESSNYAGLIDLEITTPAGMHTTFRALFEILLECQAFAESTMDDVIIPLKRWASLAYNDAEVRQSIRVPTDIKPSDSKKLVDKLSIAVTYRGAVKRPYGDCFDRNSDWDFIYNSVVELNSRFAVYNPKRFNDEVNQLSEIIIKLSNHIDIIGKDGKNKKMVQAMSELMFKAAKQVEFYAVYHTVLLATLSALQINVENLRKILRK